MTEDFELSMTDLYILFAVVRINDQDMPASSSAVMTLLSLVPILTDVVFEEGEVLDSDGIASRMDRLEGIGLIAGAEHEPSVENVLKMAQVVGDVQGLERLEVVDRAVAFVSRALDVLDQDSLKAIFAVVLCTGLSEAQNWDRPEDSDLESMVRDNLPELLDTLQLGLKLATVTRQAWIAFGVEGVSAQTNGTGR